jgi:hypothetical protein
MIPVVIFTFGPDGLAALMAAESAAKAGLGPVFIEIDGKNPVTPEMEARMTRSGFRVSHTSFLTPNRLLGLDCFKGMLQSYRRIFGETGATHVFKLDSDTLVQDAGRIRRAVKADVSAAASSCPTCNFYGCAMVVSKRLTEAIGDHIIRWGGMPGFANKDLCEDLAFGHMSDKLGLGETRRWEYNPTGSYLAGWQFNPEKTELYKTNFDVVTFGNRHLLTGKNCERRDKVADAMVRYMRHPEKILEPANPV